MQKISRNNETKYLLLIILAICFLATGGIFVKISDLPPISTGFYRVLLSLPILLPFTYNKLKRISKKEVIVIIIAGVFLAGDLILWNISFYFTTVANANLLANLVPFTIIPVSYFLFKEKISKSFFIGLIVTLTGIVVLMLGKINPSIENFQGDFLAFSTSIFYSLFLLTVYKLRDKIDTTVIMFISGIGSSITLFIAMYFKEGIFVPTTFNQLYPLILLAIISQILGQGLLAFCLGKVSASLSSVLVLGQPVIAAIYSFLIFYEKLSMVEILGIVVTSIGIYFAKKGSESSKEELQVENTV